MPSYKNHKSNLFSSRIIRCLCINIVTEHLTVDYGSTDRPRNIIFAFSMRCDTLSAHWDCRNCARSCHTRIDCTQPSHHWNSLSDERTRAEAQAKYNPRSRMLLYDIKIKTSFFFFCLCAVKRAIALCNTIVLRCFIWLKHNEKAYYTEGYKYNRIWKGLCFKDVWQMIWVGCREGNGNSSVAETRKDLYMLCNIRPL